VSDWPGRVGRRTAAASTAPRPRVRDNRRPTIDEFAGWVARGSVGHPMLDGIDYWDDLKDSPSQMETRFAIFATSSNLTTRASPSTRKYAERRAGRVSLPVLHGGPPGRRARARALGIPALLTGADVAATCAPRVLPAERSRAGRRWMASAARRWPPGPIRRGTHRVVAVVGQSRRWLGRGAGWPHD